MAIPNDDSLHRFLRLYAQNQQRVHAFVCTMLPSRPDADDVLQETSIALWQKWSEFDESRDFYRWACGIARIEVLRHRQRHASSRLLFCDELLTKLAEESLDQSAEPSSEEHALEACLGKLRESDKKLVEYRYSNGVTARKTARDLGRSSSTVYKALVRIRKNLLACIRRQMAQEVSV